MRAVNMLESMFELLLQPPKPGDEELPASPTVSSANGQLPESMEVGH